MRARARRSAARSIRSQAGFSLIELLIAMVIVVQILIAALTVFDVHNKMSHVQMQITEVQQAIRVAQYDMVRTTRLAGRGGLAPGFTIVDGPGSAKFYESASLEVRNNLIDDEDRQVSLGDVDSPLAVEGTDMLIVRGCVSGLMFQVDTSNPADFQADPPGEGTVGVADFGFLTLRRLTAAGREQSLESLQNLTPDTPLLIVSATSREMRAIGEFMEYETAATADKVDIQLAWTSQLDPANPLINLPDLEMSASFVCALEEYRYYVRENFSVPADATSTMIPRLSRARMIPGTETPFGADATNLSLDLAEEIIDLQVALGLDTDFDLDGAAPGSFDDDYDSEGNDDVLYEGVDNAARGTDDWLWNSTEDDTTDAQYVNADLINVRISTVGRTGRPDRGYLAPDFDPVVGSDLVEDNDYDDTPAEVWKQGENRLHRRRMLQTVVDMRNM